jgi:hypothetical protein
MHAPTTDTTRLLRQLYRALQIAIDDARRGGVTYGPDSQVEKALAAYSAWFMTVPDDDDC